MNLISWGHRLSALDLRYLLGDVLQIIPPFVFYSAPKYRYCWGGKTLAGPSVGSQDRDWKTIDIESVLDFKNVDLSIIILYVPIDRTMYLDGAPPTYSINVLVQYMCYG